MAGEQVMPEAWLIRKIDDYGSFKYTVNDLPACTVPTLLCPDCGEIRTWALSYPSIDADALGEDARRHLECGKNYRSEPLSLAQYRELEETLAPVLGPKRPLKPFTGLGPSTGMAEGAFPDFAWPVGAVQNLFLRRSVYEACRDAGFALTGVEPNLRYRRARRDPLIELEILPSLHVIDSQRPKTCATCGFTNDRPQGVRLSPEDYDDTIPLQRIYERPELIVANAAFAAFIRERELTDARLTPMIFE
jgi:hypothetical protein